MKDRMSDEDRGAQTPTDLSDRRGPHGDAVKNCLNGQPVRRGQLLMIAAGGEASRAAQILDESADLYGDRALANLMLNRFIPEANRHLQYVAHWYEHPHPTGRLHIGECDFVAIRLARTWYLLSDDPRLEAVTRQATLAFFGACRIDSPYHSENHALIFRVSRYLMAKVMFQERFEAYHRIGAELLAEDGPWLDRFLRYRARQGWGEFDSPGYFGCQWKCLTALHDFCGPAGRLPQGVTPAQREQDFELQRLARMTMDVLLADMAVDSLDGMYCGAHGRMYPPQAMDHRAESCHPHQYLYFGQGDIGAITDVPVDLATSIYAPHEAVVRLALERDSVYENRERKHLHNLFDECPIDPIAGSIRKYTYWTPDYVMGAIQQQDPYPPEVPGGRKHDHDDATPNSWYAHHQQHEWDLSFRTGPRARIFTQHPGRDGEHNYWTGDRGCGCGHFLQHRSSLVALYDIAVDQPCQFIHTYLRRDAFDEVLEENGIIFVRAGEAFAALRLLGGYRWTQEGEWAGCELISDGPRHGVVCEAALLSEYASFAAFRSAFSASPVTYDPANLVLEYQSPRNGHLRLSAGGERRVNGMPLDLEYDTYDAPGMHSAWDSGVIQLSSGIHRLTLDFTANGSD